MHAAVCSLPLFIRQQSDVDIADVASYVEQQTTIGWS